MMHHANIVIGSVSSNNSYWNKRNKLSRNNPATISPLPPLKDMINGRF